MQGSRSLQLVQGAARCSPKSMASVTSEGALIANTAAPVALRHRASATLNARTGARTGRRTKSPVMPRTAFRILGFFWIVSNDANQQKLLGWSMILAKRHYPELPHCVATSDNSFSCDAQMIYFEPTRDDPSHESVYALHLSPFDTTYFLCNRSMIIFRFDHLLSGVPFQTSKHFFEENNVVG